MKEPEEHDRTVMIGASFDEIAAEAAIAVKREIERHIHGVVPDLARAVDSGTAALIEATAALIAARSLINMYRFTLLVLVGLCAVEGAWLASLLFHL